MLSCGMVSFGRGRCLCCVFFSLHFDVAVKCPKLPTPEFGQSNPVDCGNSSYQMGCWFNCDEGYKLKGKGLLTCQEDGTWTGHSPNCERESHYVYKFNLIKCNYCSSHNQSMK